MKRARVVLFWLHLVAGSLGGLFIAVMATTGILLSFSSEIIALADGSSSLVAEQGTSLPIDALVARATVSGVKSGAVTWKPGAPLYVAFVGGGGRFVDPHTGEVWRAKGEGARRIFGFVEDVHRALGAEGGKSRDVGKTITGGGALAFLFLGLSGLFLWLPRRWRWKNIRAVAFFRRGLSGKARDFNWHNVIGLWCLPVLLVISTTGIVIGFHWASDLVYRAMGEAPPASSPPPPKLPNALPLDELFARVRAVAPDAQSITMRNPSTFLVKDGTGPAFTARAVSLDPATGAVLKNEGWPEATRARKVRVWIRFLHTGQALGTVGQLAAALACIGALFLVWTGFALALRRLFAYQRSVVAAESG